MLDQWLVMIGVTLFKHSRAVNYPGATHPSEINGMADRQKKLMEDYRENIIRLNPEPEPATPQKNLQIQHLMHLEVKLEDGQGPPTPGTLRGLSGFGTKGTKYTDLIFKFLEKRKGE